MHLQNGTELKPRRLVAGSFYPGLWTVVKKLHVAFSALYLVECHFSAVIQLSPSKEIKSRLLNVVISDSC